MKWVIIIGIVVIGAVLAGSKYYTVYLNNSQYGDEFRTLQINEVPAATEDIKDFEIFSHNDSTATVLYIHGDRSQYFVKFKREHAADLTARFEAWHVTGEPEKVRDDNGKYLRYYFPIYF